MGRTLLVSHPRWSWREWLKGEGWGGEGGDLVVLDPGNPDWGTPGRVGLVRGGKVVAWRLVGCLEVQKNPVAVLGAGMWLLGLASAGAAVLLWPMRLSPVLRQMALAVSQAGGFDRILVPEGSRFEHQGWPVGAETVELGESFPPMVQEAQRRARWLELDEQCVEHRVVLEGVSIEGARLGSGVRLKRSDFPHYGEVSGGTLHVVSEARIEEDELFRAMDVSHAEKLSQVKPEAYRGLLCSFANQEGEDFGMGWVEDLDLGSGILVARNTAVAPAPVRVLRLGTLRVLGGREAGSANLWTV